MSETLSDATKALNSAANSAVHATVEMAREARDEVRGAGIRTQATMTRQVRAQPLTAVMVAAGVGMLAGALMARSIR
jgi:ElaB/YqjD/DUF883 family membrane-anchored ribosome-binding protein